MRSSDVDRCMTEPSRSGYLEQCLYCIYNVLNCKSEFLEQLRCRAACAKGLHCHISAVETREDFRQVSYARLACFATITGEGLQGYAHALELLKEYLLH